MLRKKSPWPDAQAPRRALGLDEVYRLHAEEVAHWALRMGGPSTDVEDVVQEVFLQVHRALPGFRGQSTLKTWLYRVTQSVLSQRRRKDRWRSWLRTPMEDVQELVASSAPSPQEETEQREAQRRIYKILDRMSEGYRQLLILFELEELSGEQIAEMTGLKLATVWVRLHRARRQFARELGALQLLEEEAQR